MMLYSDQSITSTQVWGPSRTSLHIPFENPQRWMGQNTFPILLLNDDNMIGELQKTRMKMLYGCPFEKKEKKFFFQTNNFFFRNKKILFKEQLLFSFICITMQKKISVLSKKNFFENLLSNFRKKNIKNFRIAPKFFFALYYIRN